MVTVVKCPSCGAAVQWTPSSTYRPFCSERCKMVDLGAWAAERYTISKSEEEQEELDDEEPLSRA